MTSNESHHLVPGDVLLVRERSHESNELVRYPIPSADPNDPLNWSNWRKFFNYFLIMAQTVAVFTALSTQTVFWPQMTVDLGLPIPVLNNAQSAMAAGLSVGCIFFIPFTKKYGRRSTYVISTAVMAATSWWIYKMQTKAELFLINLFYGLAGATNETIVQVTISDLFFVHQRGTMNAFYLTAVMVGSFLTPMIAGVQAQSQGWRQSYLALAISLTVVFILVLIGYEETKYVPVLQGVSDQYKIDTETSEADYISRNVDTTKNTVDPKATELTVMPSHVNVEVPPNTYRQRLRWLTPSSESLLKIAIFPIHVITFPHVMYAAVQYACGVASLVTLASMVSIAFSAPPYNFGPAGLGYMNLGPFVGNIIGSFFTGYLSDVSLRWLAKRNKGYYEPEMRLYLLLLPSFCISGGLIMFGVTTAKGMHWIYPSIGGALFAFGLGAIGDVAFTMVIDSYRPLTAEAFVGISFIRNAISIPIPFAISPWMRGMGIQNMFILLGLVVFAFALLFIPMIIWGKKLRAYYTPKYYKLLEKQGGIAADALAAGQTS